jgi:hypothetical protein
MARAWELVQGIAHYFDPELPILVFQNLYICCGQSPLLPNSVETFLLTYFEQSMEFVVEFFSLLLKAIR